LKRILYVSIQSSPHTARWIDCVADDSDLDLHMFGHDQHPPNKLLRNVTLHWPLLSALRSAQDVPPFRQALPRAKLGWRARGERFMRHALRQPGSALEIVKRKILGRMRPMKPDLGVPEGGFGIPDAMNPAASQNLRIVEFKPFIQVSQSQRIPFGETDADCSALNGPAVLAEVIERVKPDIIHSMEFQHCAYLVLAARDIIGAEQFPRWLATNWGSDIYLFGRDEKHAGMIRRVLSAADFYSCECHRDVKLGREFGYRGPDLPVLPNSGHLDLSQVEPLQSNVRPSARKKIMVKGYDHFAGRAMVSLAVLERFADQLKDYEIVLYSVGARPRARALELKASGALNIRVIDYAEHEEILWNFGRSRVYLGVSISDAISTSVLESMAMGCFPIQTNTSCCDEWFEDGVGGFTVPPDDIEAICRRFQSALEDDRLVDMAQDLNRRVISARLASGVVKAQVRELYEQCLAD